jgi:hypothetical protein
LIESESIEPEKAVLISPNLGHPLFLDIDHKFKQKESWAKPYPHS